MTQPEASEYDRLFYPFLFEGGKSSLADVLEQVRASTLDKSRDLVALRRRVLDSMQDRILAVGQALARCFEAGGTLFAFGNGGRQLSDRLVMVPTPHQDCLIRSQTLVCIPAHVHSA